MAEEIKEILEDHDEIDVEALKSELAKLKAERERLKTSLDRTASEVADYKKKYREKLDAEEQEKLNRQEHDDYVKGLERQIKQNEAFARYSSLGMGLELAKETAEFEVAGDISKVTDNIKKYQDTLVESAKTKWLESRPEIKSDNGGSSDDLITAEQFAKMSYAQKNELYKKDRELYNKLAGH